MSHEDITSYLRMHNAAFQNGHSAPDISVLSPSAAARVTRFLAIAGPERMVAAPRPIEPAPIEAPPQAAGSIGTENLTKLQEFASRLATQGEQ